MDELHFQVIIDPSLDRKVKGVVAFGDFETEDPQAVVYGKGEAHVFFRDLIFGRSFPLTFVTRKIDTLGTLLSIALFLHRDLAINTSLPGLIAQVSLVDFHGVVGYAHTDEWTSRFFKLLLAQVQGPTDRAGQQEALRTAVEWLREFILEGHYPAALPLTVEPPRVIDRGTDGFVVATATHPDLYLGWEHLYRSGFLRGILMYQVSEDRWKVLGARKSSYLGLDLNKAAAALNEAESAMEEPSEWQSDGFWLHGPERGTLILPSSLLDLLLRV